MKHEQHCNECEQNFGSPYAEIHTWLDEFAGSKQYGMRHRRVRHHEAGILQVMELFGGEAGIAARLHILADLREEGWKETDHFPLNEQEYINMGLF